MLTRQYLSSCYSHLLSVTWVKCGFSNYSKFEAKTTSFDH